MRKLSDDNINKIAKYGSIKIFKLLKTQYSISYTHPLPLNNNAPYIFVSNHQSCIDPVLIFAAVMGQIRLIAKKDLFDVPLFGKALALGGCIAIDRDHITDSVDAFKNFKEKLQGKTKWWIFAEGTRSKTDILLPFKTGAFRLARESGAKIIPAAIKNTRSVLPIGSIVPAFNQTISIRLGEPIDTQFYSSMESQQLLINKVRQTISQLLENPL